jgi:hypothetical protein
MRSSFHLFELVRRKTPQQKLQHTRSKITAALITIAKRPTVCVPGRWAGVDNTWEQENSKPEKRSKMATNPTCPVLA